MNRQVIVLLGAPGSGKGTLATRLCAAAPLIHISTGDLFRQHMQNGTELGREAKRCIEQGLLVPDQLTLDMLLERLEQPDVAKTESGVIIDGFPRTFEQARVLINEAPHLRAILIEIDKESLAKRVLGRVSCPACGRIYNTNHKDYFPRKSGFCDTCPDQGLVKREDDCEELLEKRWNSYIKQTKPAVEFYRGLGCLVDYTILSQLPAEEILKQLAL